MNKPAQLLRMFLLCTACATLLPAQAATPEVPDKRDGQVLDALMLHLLSDPQFDLTRVSTNGSVIILHAQTPEKTGLLQPQQLSSDVGGHTLPVEAMRNLQRRNSPPNAKPDTYDAVAASFTNLTFSVGIVVADLNGMWKEHRSFTSFEEAYPKARGYVKAYLPGYSKDGIQALVRASLGPSPHGAMLTALLEKRGDTWVVKWQHITRYV